MKDITFPVGIPIIKLKDAMTIPSLYKENRYTSKTFPLYWISLQL